MKNRSIFIVKCCIVFFIYCSINYSSLNIRPGVRLEVRPAMETSREPPALLALEGAEEFPGGEGLFDAQVLYVHL